MSRLSKVTTGRVQKPQRIVLYGTPGLGKSTFAAGAPKPIFLAVEDGTNELDVARMPDLGSFDDVIASLDELGTTEHPYKTVVIDTVDALESLVYAAVCKRLQVKSVEDVGYGKGYEIALDYHKLLTARLDRLRDRGIGSILVAHSGIRTFTGPDSQPYDRYEMKLHKKASAHYFGWADAVLFARYEVFATKDKNAPKAKGVSSGERIMLTEYNAAYDAKNRYGLPPQLPLSYEAYRAARAAASQVSKEGDVTNG